MEFWKVILILVVYEIHRYCIREIEMILKELMREKTSCIRKPLTLRS